MLRCYTCWVILKRIPVLRVFKSLLVAVAEIFDGQSQTSCILFGTYHEPRQEIRRRQSEDRTYITRQTGPTSDRPLYEMKHDCEDQDSLGRTARSVYLVMYTRRGGPPTELKVIGVAHRLSVGILAVLAVKYS